MEQMLQPLRKYAQFTGRARRSEYWLFFLFTFVIVAVLEVLMFATMGNGGNALTMVFSLLLVVVGLGLLVPSLAVGFRRLHDTNRSAWWMLIGLIPFGGLVLLVFYLLPGTVGPNQFGDDPKGGTAAAFA